MQVDRHFYHYSANVVVLLYSADNACFAFSLLLLAVFLRFLPSLCFVTASSLFLYRCSLLCGLSPDQLFKPFIFSFVVLFLAPCPCRVQASILPLHRFILPLTPFPIHTPSHNAVFLRLQVSSLFFLLHTHRTCFPFLTPHQLL